MNLTRLTLFALISSLEEDLRQLVRDHLLTTAVDLQAVVTSDVVARCKDRWAKDQSEKSEPTDGVLLDYTDLSDVLQALTRMKSSLPSTVSEPITRHYSS